MILLLSLLVALVGLLMFVLAEKAKITRIGEIMFQAGLFVALLALAPEAVKLWPTGH